MTEPNDQPRFSESQLRGIIARAAHPGDPLYSASEIREIGAELGIDAAAIDDAIVNMKALEMESASRVLGLGRYTSYGLTLGFIGAASLLTPGVGSFSIIACGSMLALSGALTRVRDTRRAGNVTTFLRRNFVAWGSFIIGGTTFARFGNPSWLGEQSTATGLSIAGLWLVSSIVGAAMVRHRAPPDDRLLPGESGDPWRARLASRLKRWVDAILVSFGEMNTSERAVHGRIADQCVNTR